MTPFTSFFKTASQDDAPMPDARTEEYRYSRVIEGLHNLNLDEALSIDSPKEIPCPWYYDIIFYDTDQNGKSRGWSHQAEEMYEYHDLNPVFRRSRNYFKDLLAPKGRITSITLDQYRPDRKRGYYSPGESKPQRLNVPKEDEPRFDLTVSAGKNRLSSPKFHFRVSKGQKASLYLHTMSEENGLVFPFIFIEAEEDSTLEIFYRPQAAYNKGILCPWIETAAQAGAQVRLYSFAKDLPMQRMTFFGYLLGEKSDISLHTSFHLDKNDSADLFVRIFHESGDATSNQHINAVALGTSNMNFNGQIAADKNAKQISAYQMFKGLLLSEKAQITARPQLDIEYFDLACSHGVSIGGFTEEELFYLQSRGLKDEEIYPLLTYGFLSEPFAEMDKNGLWRTEIKKELSVS